MSAKYAFGTEGLDDKNLSIRRQLHGIFYGPTCPLERSKVVTLKEGAAIWYRGETGIFRSIKNVVECGGGHGEGRWMMPLFVLVTLDCRVIRIEDGISKQEAVEVLN